MDKPGRPGIRRILIGIMFLIIQMVAWIGNNSTGIGYLFDSSNSKVLVYNLISVISYNFFGLIGLVLLIIGIIAFAISKPKTEENELKSEEDSVDK